MKQAYPGSEVQFLESSGGAFEVEVDGKLVFSKKATGQHATPGEVLELIRAEID